MAFFSVDDGAHGHPNMGRWAPSGRAVDPRRVVLSGLQTRWADPWLVCHVVAQRQAVSCSFGGRWPGHEAGHKCDDCDQPDDKTGYIFHDWLDIHEGASEIERPA